MKLKIYTPFLLLFSPFILASDHSDKMILEINSPDERECIFFLLEGVSTADPDVNSSGWFSVPKTHHEYEVIVSMLLASKMANKPVSVRTTGETACNHAEVAHLKIK